MSARTTALAALIACRKADAWSDSVLKDYSRRDRLDRRDAALASRLCYGVLQNRMLLDFYIQSQLKGKLNALQPVVLDILRLGAYQITQMDKIPTSAAVNEAVEQTKKYANQRASGLVNGVLRSIVRTGDQLTQPEDLATLYSHPQPLVELLRREVGEEALPALLKSHNEAPPTTVQINPLCAKADLLQRWEAAGVQAEEHPWLDGCYFLSATGNVEQLPGFSEGEVLVQDAAARLAVLGAGLKPGMLVLDCCAAPGGKSFAAAMAMENQGTLFSCDIHPHKIKLIDNGAQRLGITMISAMEQDASKYRSDWQVSMDVVIADVPCSGLGVIRKKPDIRYKDLNAMAGLVPVQARILETVQQYVKPGGVLLYSTCTILKQENEGQVASFLKTHPEFTLEKMDLPGQLEQEGMVTLYPSVHGTDGFFIAKLRKQV